MELEFLKTSEKILCFLNFHDTTINAENENIIVTLSSKTSSLNTVGYLRKGNQRIILEDLAIDFILQTLKKNQNLTIQCEQIKELVSPKNFEKNLKLFLNNNPNSSSLLKIQFY